MFPEFLGFRSESLFFKAFGRFNMLVKHLDPLVGLSLIAALEPKLTLIAIERNFELDRLLLILHDEAPVQVEVERALILHLALGFLVVLENTFIDLNKSLLPPCKQGRTVLQ